MLKRLVLIAVYLSSSLAHATESNKTTTLCTDELLAMIGEGRETYTLTHPAYQRALVRRYLRRAEFRIKYQIERACRGAVCSRDTYTRAIKDATEDVIADWKVGMRKFVAMGVWATGVLAMCTANVIAGSQTQNTVIAGSIGILIGAAVIPLLQRFAGPLDQKYGGKALAWSSGPESTFSVRQFYEKIWALQIRVPGTVLKGAEIISDLKLRIAPDFFEAANLLRRQDEKSARVAAKIVAEAALTIGDEFRFLLNRSEEASMQSIARRAHVVITEAVKLPPDFKRWVMEHIEASDPEARRDGLIGVQYQSLLSDWLDPLEDPNRNAQRIVEIDEVTRTHP